MSVDPRIHEVQTAPVDEGAAAALAARGYELRLVDPADREAVERYLQAENRGFLGGALPDRALQAHAAEYTASRRMSAVYDPEGADPLTPIATSASWIGPLTLPGEQEIDAWAIAGVTTAQTHRRRGIQRQIIEAELRTAHRLGVPIAMLTVSESSIYGRYGFGVAALAAEYRVDTRDLRWTGPSVGGRLDFIPVTRWREQAPDLFEQTRLRDPGQVQPFALRWDEIAGFAAREGDKSGERFAVQYRDDAGVVRGMAIYTVSADPEVFTRHRVNVLQVIAVSDDSYAAIWRFFVEMDLVASLGYDLGAVDERLPWMVSNFRAVQSKPFDMQYVRVLDVPRVLEARGFESDGEVAFAVTDDLGIAGGAWRLRAGPDGVVSSLDGAVDTDETVTVAELSALVAGGIPPGSSSELSRLLRGSRTPWLGSWY